MTDKDQKLIHALGKVNAATATFSTGLFMGELDHKDHMAMALMLLGAADQILGRLAEGSVV